MKNKQKRKSPCLLFTMFCTTKSEMEETRKAEKERGEATITTAVCRLWGPTQWDTRKLFCYSTVSEENKTTRREE
jgi:hypothetical protein